MFLDRISAWKYSSPTESLLAQLKDFRKKNILNNTMPVVGMDGRIPLIIAMAAKKSYLEHRPVKLSEIEHLAPEPA